MRCLRRCTLVVLSLCAVLAASSIILARHVSAWLEASDELASADAIVVLGQDPTRVFEAADLYRKGYAPRVLLSHPKRRSSLIYLESQGISVPWFEVAGHKILRDRGVPEAAIGSLGENLISTVTEARAVATALPAARRLIVVTSPYHVRRARIVFHDTLRGVDVRVAASHYEVLPRAWWTEEESAMDVVMEFIKLAYFEAGGRMLS
jgi:uncharacterized SAM-binding protein YcdF (DUF218 family)